MKKILFALCVLTLASCGSSDKKTAPKEAPADNAGLEKRLEEYFAVNEKMDVDRVMDYTYPKLFEIVPREQLAKAMKEGFNNESVTMDIDSLKVLKIHPSFEMGKGMYARIDYSMVMMMTIHNADMDDPKVAEKLSSNLYAQFGEENVSILPKGVIRIYQKSPMIAIKDDYSKDWTFVNMKDDEGMLGRLFPKDVLDKLETYK